MVVCEPSRKRCEAALKEWTQERSFDILQECESYREKQADEFIKRMETVPEGSSAHKTYDDAARRYLLGRCTLAEFFGIQRRRDPWSHVAKFSALSSR